MRLFLRLEKEHGHAGAERNRASLTSSIDAYSKGFHNAADATLEKGAHLKMEMVVALNKGFVPAELNKDEELSVDFIAVDSIHSPILKVNYWVENARVGRTTDYDKLIMEINTDGSITPDDALAISSKIVKEHMNLFINFEEEDVQDEKVEKESEQEKNKLYEKLNKHVNELELSVRSINCLQNANIGNIGY